MTLKHCVLLVFTVLVPLLLSPAAFSLEPTSRVQVYTTYAPAKIVRGYIAPLLKEGETITLFRGKMIINASIYTHANIQETLERIDHPAQTLLVSIRTANTEKKESTSDPVKPPIILFSGTSSNAPHFSTNNKPSINTPKSPDIQQIHLVEGEVGYLKGKTEKYKNTPVFVDGFFRLKRQLEKDGSGLYVSVRLNGELATITLSHEEISFKNHSSISKPTANIKEIITPLGTWASIQSKIIHIAPDPPQQNHKHYSTETLKNDTTALEILVETAR